MKRQLVSTVVGLQPQRREHILYHGARLRDIHLLTVVNGCLRFCQFCNFCNLHFWGSWWGTYVGVPYYKNKI